MWIHFVPAENDSNPTPVTISEDHHCYWETWRLLSHNKKIWRHRRKCGGKLKENRKLGVAKEASRKVVLGCHEGGHLGRRTQRLTALSLRGWTELRSNRGWATSAVGPPFPKILLAWSWKEDGGHSSLSSPLPIISQIPLLWIPWSEDIPCSFSSPSKSVCSSFCMESLPYLSYCIENTHWSAKHLLLQEQFLFLPAAQEEFAIPSLWPHALSSGSHSSTCVLLVSSLSTCLPPSSASSH